MSRGCFRDSPSLRCAARQASLPASGRLLAQRGLREKRQGEPMRSMATMVKTAAGEEVLEIRIENGP